MAAATPDPVQDFFTHAPVPKDDLRDASVRKGEHTFDEAIEYIGFGPFQWKLVFLCGFVWAAESMELMILAFVLPKVKEDWHLSRFTTSSVGAFTFGGMLAGSYAWGVVSDRFGRRVSMLSSVSCTLLFGVTSAAATGPISLTVLRTLVGFGIGGSSVSFSLLAEYVPVANRGGWLTIVQGAFWSFGILNETWLAWAIVPSQGWRCLLVVSAIPLLVLLAVHWFFLPESARWLAVRGQTVQAQYFLREVAVTNHRPLGSEFELRLISKAKVPTLASLFSPKLTPLTTSVWVLWTCNVFVYYGCVLFTDTLFRKQSDWSVYAVALVTGLSEIPGLLVAVALIDRKGRRLTQAMLFTMCAACLCFLTGMARFPTGLLLLFMFCARGAAVGAFVTLYTFTAEVYPTTCRATGLGAACAMGRLGGILTIYVALMFSTPQLYIPVLLYIAVSCVGAALALRLPWETKHRELPDVDHDLRKDYTSTNGRTHGDL
eukprot:TRINITY_DN14550_c0_g1_i1.p1 TRINITY_DN14550_c0_g1~~TRINITY_DN14550_c0_g1_i1.p1  ORF type:complete len:488 (-),score=106.01 TRINITY_DN14550_c0_g1_i1:158-1621(-)